MALNLRGDPQDRVTWPTWCANSCLMYKIGILAVLV